MANHVLPLVAAALLTSAPSTYCINAFIISSPMTSYSRSKFSSSSLRMDKKEKAKQSSGGFGKKVTASNLRTKTKRLDPRNFVYTGTLRPYEQSPMRIVDPAVVSSLPDYAIDGIPKKKGSSSIVEVKSAEDIIRMRASGKLARQVLDLAGSLVKPGITTDEIDAAVHAACLERGAYPSPLNYRKYPKSCCTSVNEVICHGIPDMRPLQLGDVLNIDITVYLDGYHGDCSEMFVVGGKDAADDNARQLIQTTYDCWIQAMELVKPGMNYNVIGRSIQEYVEPRGFSTVHSFCGHGIGQVFHTAPNIYHYTVNQPLEVMEAGHVFTIEPMICEGQSEAYMWPDDWTATTVDGKRSAQFEHTLLITLDGVEALTAKIDSSPIQFWEEESTISRGVWLGTSKNARERARA
jgi:methionyl aminopeptidase